jgi:hypothetical protein
MKNKHSKIIDKVISSLDWDAIFEVNKCFKHGVGEGTSAIPGVKRKPFSDGITKNDIKNELKGLLKYVVENDYAELIYGYWMIFWNNAEWAEEDIRKIREEMDDDDDEGLDLGEISIDNSLEVIYSPQRTFIVEARKSDGTTEVEDKDVVNLESMLKKALESEQYELASKIRDVIKLQKNQADSDTYPDEVH